MSITLPAIPKEAEVTLRLTRAGADLGGQNGAAIQRVNRLGSRFAMDVNIPPMEAVQAADFLSARMSADTLGDTLIAVFPQPALSGSLGAPQVNGAGQSGATLAVKGLTAGVTVPKGRFFSVVVSGRNYLYVTRSAVVASGGGLATLDVGPKLRKPPPDSGALDFAAAKLEGFIMADAIEWTLERLTWLGMSFTLRENK